jgi:hypothetical protein
MRFSQRKGYKPIRDTVQKDCMDDELRNGLWNALDICIWKGNKFSHYSDNFESSNLYLLFQRYWLHYFKYPLDNLPGYYKDSHARVRKYFLNCEWYEVYDFIEFTAQSAPEGLVSNYTNTCNRILEKEQSAYRFVDNQITDLTAEEEIESIEHAIKSSSNLSGVNTHLKTAIGFLSDRKNPNFRNSVKESISAVEALSRIISGDPKATLGTALKRIEEKNAIHSALKKAFSSLYGYTNDSGGIRHAMLEESNISHNDAKFMLVSCSAFINYLLGKLSEEGTKLKS